MKRWDVQVQIKSSGMLFPCKGLLMKIPLAQKIAPTAHRLLTTTVFLLKETPAYKRGLRQFSSPSIFSVQRLGTGAMTHQNHWGSFSKTGFWVYSWRDWSGMPAMSLEVWQVPLVGPVCSHVEGALFLSLFFWEHLITKS